MADLAHCYSPGNFDGAAQVALREFDTLSQSSSARFACRAGCSLCCSLRVDVFAHDIFHLARHICAHFTDEDLDALLARLAAHAEKVLPLTPYDHATQNIPCPMLREGCCSVYAARPHSCRRHHSLDFAACQYTYDHPADIDTPAAHDRPVYRTLSAAMQQDIEAYAAHGFDHTIYELGTALHEALTDPECWPRWRNGGTAFLQASITPAE